MRNRILYPFALIAAVAASAGAQGANPDTTTRVRRSWTSDRRDYREGDIITVLVDEQTLATASKGQSGSDDQKRNLGLDIQPPGGPAGASVGIDVTVGSKKSSSSNQQGQAKRDLRFRGEMTVRVVKVSPNGILEIKGARTVDVDKNRQQLTLTGFVRPEDVSRANTVESMRIADAQLLYKLEGDLGKTRGGIIGRLISVFWP